MYNPKNHFCKKCGKDEDVASGCDQCVWSVGVVAGCGHWVEHSKRLIIDIN